MLGRRQDSASRTLSKPLRHTAKAHAAEITLRQMDESLARGEEECGGRKKNTKRRPQAHLLPDTPSMSTLGSSPHHQQGHEEVISIRFVREELKEEDRIIADVLRMRMGLETHLKMLKEFHPDRTEEISKCSSRWLEVSDKYMQLLESRSGAFNAVPVNGSDFGEPEQASSVAHESYTAGVYEGSSSGVPRYPAQKRRRPVPSVTVATSDADDDHGMCMKSRRISSLDEPLDPEIAAALQASEEDGTFEDV